MSENGSNALWGSRFDGGPADSLAALSRSVHFDWRLAPYDVQQTRAHARILHRAGLLTDDELGAVVAFVGDFVRDDQVVVGVDRGLHVVADDTRAPAAGCHRAAVGIGQGYLLVGRSQHLLLVDGKLAHLLLQLCELLVEPRHLRGQCLRRLLPVGRIKLAQIARDTLLQLGTPPLHLRPCEVPVPVVHGLELAAIDGDARRREKAHLTTELDEARTYPA